MITNIHNFQHSLNRIKKCDQYWNEMKPNEKGRICDECSKTIVDFSGKSIAEIAEIMLSSAEPVCGFYKPDKKNEGIKPSRITAVLTAGFLLGNNTPYAKENYIPIEQIDSSLTNEPINSDLQEAQQTKDKIILAGRIVDENEDGIAGSSIIIKGSGSGTITDIDGAFEIVISEKDNFPYSVILEMRSVGYKGIEYKVDIFDATSPKNLGAIKTAFDGEAISFYVTEKRPFFKRIWYNMKKPFRRNQK